MALINKPRIKGQPSSPMYVVPNSNILLMICEPACPSREEGSSTCRSWSSFKNSVEKASVCVPFSMATKQSVLTVSWIFRIVCPNSSKEMPRRGLSSRFFAPDSFKYSSAAICRSIVAFFVCSMARSVSSTKLLSYFGSSIISRISSRFNPS